MKLGWKKKDWKKKSGGAEGKSPSRKKQDDPRILVIMWMDRCAMVKFEKPCTDFMSSTFFSQGIKNSWSVPRSCWTLNVEYLSSLCFYSLFVVWNTSTSQSWSVSGVWWSRISIYTALPLSGFAHLKYFALPEYFEVIVHLLNFSAVIRKFRAVTAYRAS